MRRWLGTQAGLRRRLGCEGRQAMVEPDTEAMVRELQACALRLSTAGST